MKKWHNDKLDWIRDNIHLTDDELGAHFGVTGCAINQVRLNNRILRPKKEFTEKTCPICKVKKQIGCFDKYFSKERKTWRRQNYCQDCTKPEKTRRSKEYYQKKGEKVRKYQRRYRAENKEIIRPKKRAFNKKYRDEVHSLYAIDRIRQQTGLAAADIREVPELIEVEKARIKLNRTIKNKRNEK